MVQIIPVFLIHLSLANTDRFVMWMSEHESLGSNNDDMSEKCRS